MFLRLCWLLNVIRLAWLAAWLRRMAHRHLVRWLPVEYHSYSRPDRVGWAGWGEMRYLGVLWFQSLTPVGTARDGLPLYDQYRW